jgi:hypothetical protein
MHGFKSKPSPTSVKTTPFFTAEADRKFGNTRYARNLFEKLLEQQSNRVAALSDPTETDISTLEKGDLESQ